MSYCIKCNEVMRKISKLADALLRCNHAAVAGKNRLTNGGSIAQAVEMLDNIVEVSKKAMEGKE